MPYDIGDSVVDIRNINNLDNQARRERRGLITALNITIAHVSINGTIQEIPIEYLMYARLLT
jgi:hypothetical protein